MKSMAGVWGLLLGCAPMPSPERPTSAVEVRLGANLLRNGDIESGPDGRCEPWDFSPHAWTRGVPPTLSSRPAPPDVPRKPEEGRVLEVDLPGPWNVVRVLQEVQGVVPSSVYRCDGLLRVSDDFEGSVQAILSSNAGLSVYGYARRAWFNVDRAGAVFLPYHKTWRGFTVDLPCSEAGRSLLVFLVEGKGKVWMDDLRLRGIGPHAGAPQHP